MTAIGTFLRNWVAWFRWDSVKDAGLTSLSQEGKLGANKVNFSQ